MPSFKQGLLAFVAAVSAAPLCSSHAAIISISGPKPNQCGHGGVVCNGLNAFSLTELEMGVVQLPIQNSQTPEFVIVNDTGSPVTNLLLLFVGQLASNSSMNCQINGAGQQMLHSCVVIGTGASGDGTSTLTGPIDPPVQLNFIAAANQQGIAPGEFFDIKTSGFASAGQDHGYITGVARTGEGPPSQ
jgi:exosortase/archaeosortase